jgi:cytochrome P450
MQETSAVLLPKYDPVDPVVMENPYPTYARLRAAGPLCRGGPGQWAVTRYADVVRLLRDPRLGNHFPESYRQFSFGDRAMETFFEHILLNRDPPDHTRLRDLMGVAFAPVQVRRLADHIATLVDHLLAVALERGEFDAVGDLAFPLPIMVICELIGIPQIDQDAVRPRAADLCKAFGTQIPEQDRVKAAAAITWLREYIGGLLEERRKNPGDDLLSSLLLASTSEQHFTHEEIIDNVLFLFFAGFETTKDLIATGCAALLKFPRQMERLWADPSLVPSAVEEFLRYDGAIQTVGRLVLQPVEIGGRTIKKDRVLILLLGSANHDTDQFDCPEELDVGRKPNANVSFGGGVHHCLGATLARIEAGVTFNRILTHFSRFTPAGEPVRRLSAGFRSYASVPVAVRAS